MPLNYVNFHSDAFEGLTIDTLIKFVAVLLVGVDLDSVLLGTARILGVREGGEEGEYEKC